MVSLVPFRVTCPAVLAVAVAISSSRAVSDDAPPPFSMVRAIFAEKCLSCHGSNPKEIKGGYDLRTPEAAIKGGESDEVAIVPGEPEKSPLYKAVTWDDESL